MTIGFTATATAGQTVYANSSHIFFSKGNTKGTIVGINMIPLRSGYFRSCYANIWGLPVLRLLVHQQKKVRSVTILQQKYMKDVMEQTGELSIN